MKRVLILSLSIFMLLGWGLVAFGADDPAKTGTDLALGGTAIRDGVSYAGETPGWTIYVRPGVRFSSHDRTVGYLDFLVPMFFTEKSLLFFNPKASFDDRDNVEWNVGVGYRHLLASDRLILGGNVFYDGRKSYTGHDYHQIGVGAEVLTEWVNGRVNGYISLSEAQEIDRWREYYFGPTSLNYSWAYRIEEPLSGLDYEVGFKVPGLSKYVETWVYGGGYTYFADYTDNMVGWGGRIEVIPADFLKVNFMARDDNLRGTEYAGEVTVEVPFSIENLIAGKNPFEGIGTRFGGSRTMKERLYEQVRRDVDIVATVTDITRATHPDEVIPGDPSDFIPVFYVATTGHDTTGDGSLGKPFLTIAKGILEVIPERKTVYVFPGIYTGNITINKSLTLLGDPGDASAGPGPNAPIIDGGSIPGSGFFIDNGISNVTISGFEIRNFTSNGNGIGNGISAWEASTSNITVQDNYFHNLGWDGVLVGNDGALGDHTNWTIRNNILESFEAYGFELTNASNSSIADNIIHSNATWNPAWTCILVVGRRNESGIVISGNQLDGEMCPGYPAIYVLAWDTETPNVNLDNILIEGNVISTTSSTGTKQVLIYNVGTGTITGVHVHNNSLYSFRNTTPLTIDAEYNWWGSPNPDWGSIISGSVDYDPWLTSPPAP